jgi:transglutaminase-like putative cysteine protease
LVRGFGRERESYIVLLVTLNGDQFAMPTLTIRHITTYKYRQPVAFGEHRMMLRPLDSHDQRVISDELVITPTPRDIRWAMDIFGNRLRIVRFSSRARELRFDSTITLDHSHTDIRDLSIEEFARCYPFAYSAEEVPDLVRLVERQSVDPEGQIDRWARTFLREHGPNDTREFLINLTFGINRNFRHVRRDEKGIQNPLETLKLKSGSCRDLAILMIDAVRSLGLAARFVSGYLHIPDEDHDRRYVGGGNTHAWAQVYLPGPGWVDFDPSNGLVGNRDLIRVAVARDPRQAIPLHGTWTGLPADYVGMKVAVAVIAEPSDGKSPAPDSSFA